MDTLRIDVADLLARPGARRVERVETTVDDLGTPVVRVEAPIALEATLQRVPEGIVVQGALHATWTAPCSTCLREVHDDLDLRVGELYETSPVDGETYLLDGTVVDLELVVRDAIVLELPFAPTCEQYGDASGCEPTVALDTTDGADDDDDGDDAPVIDERWAPLAQLKL